MYVVLRDGLVAAKLAAAWRKLALTAGVSSGLLFSGGRPVADETWGLRLPLLCKDG